MRNCGGGFFHRQETENLYSDTQALTLRTHSRPAVRTAMGEVAIIVGFMSYYVPADYAVPSFVRIAWQACAILTSIFGGIMLLASKRINRRSASILAYYFYWYIALRLVGGNYSMMKCMGHFAFDAGFFAFLEYLLQTRDTKTVMKYFLIAGVAITTIHFATFLMHMGTGMLEDTPIYRGGKFVGFITYEWYFLKHDNGSIYYLIPIIVLLFYYSVYYSAEAFVYFTAYSAFVLFMFYYNMSATAIVASTYLVGILVYLLFVRRNSKNIPRLLYSCKFSVAAGIIADITPLMIVGSSAVKSIVAMFGKSVTFSGRDRVWARSALHFLRSPIYGLGIEDDITTTVKIGINHCHNLVLENLYRGGIIALILFLFMLKMYFPPKPNKYKCAIFCAGIVSYFITAAFDWYYYYPLPLSMFVFNYYVNKEDNISR